MSKIASCLDLCDVRRFRRVVGHKLPVSMQVCQGVPPGPGSASGNSWSHTDVSNSLFSIEFWTWFIQASSCGRVDDQNFHFLAFDGL